MLKSKSKSSLMPKSFLLCLLLSSIAFGAHGRIGPHSKNSAVNFDSTVNDVPSLKPAGKGVVAFLVGLPFRLIKDVASFQFPVGIVALTLGYQRLRKKSIWEEIGLSDSATPGIILDVEDSKSATGPSPR